ncbi:MAG: ergothioneine biosynthesis protein EgtB [Acidobacteriota bacterium]
MDRIASPQAPHAPLRGPDELLTAYRRIRSLTESLCQPLAVEDFVVQSMPDASPAKWHLAHTSWFFEALALGPHLEGYRPFDDAFNDLFNSYYNSLGEPFTRADRGLVTRPTVAETLAYRRHVDQRMARLLGAADSDAPFLPTVEIGLHHEQQHQELLLTDLKHLFSRNPLAPSYRAEPSTPAEPKGAPLRWNDHDGGLVSIGHVGGGFAYDNEGPRHRVFLEPFQIASRPVTCGEWLNFIADGGYRRPDPWLSDGWNTVQAEGWRAPLYWYEQDGAWWHFTLSGPRAVRADEPVCHVSFYEADAYARWAGARLPRESEWELALGPFEDRARATGNFLDDGYFHPRPAPPPGPGGDPLQTLGDVWEWTASPYVPYPGYRPPSGALGEYNAKFMSSQLVLRGGSCATPRDHIRITYRNFFPPHARWQFMGLRLARDRNSELR